MKNSFIRYLSPFLIPLAINLLCCKTTSQTGSSSCGTGKEVTVPSLDQTAPAITMDIYIQSKPVLSVSSISAPISSIVSSQDAIGIVARGDDPEGIHDIQIWEEDSYWTTSGRTTMNTQRASNLNNIVVGGIGCTARVATYTIQMPAALSQAPDIISYRAIIHAVAFNFQGVATSSSSVTLWWPNAGTASSITSWWPGEQTPWDITFWWTGRQTPIVDGGLYLESTHPEIYEIHNNKKIWIPTPDALLAMGYNWSDVKVVADGALNGYPRFNIPSTSPTPGSIIFPKDDNHKPISDLSNTTSVISQQSEVQLIELRGWLRSPSEDCNNDNEADGADYEYKLELDMDWVHCQGWDIHKLLRVGNIVVQCQPAPDSKIQNPFARNTVSLPLIHCELNSWGWGSPPYPNTLSNLKPPIDWNTVNACIGKRLGKVVIWPFNPQEDSFGTILNIGNYVKIWGSIVTDDPHENEPFWDGQMTDIGRAFYGPGSAYDWDDRSNSFKNPSHNARWTELHTVDKIIFVDNRTPRVTTRGVALCAGISLVPYYEDIQFDLYPEANPPLNCNNCVVKWDTSIGSESNFHSDANNGSWITPFNDHIHVYAKVWGGGWGGSPGRFKAIYTVWWWWPPYKTRFVETPTTFPPETDGIWLMADYDKDNLPDLVFIKTSNAATVEVHIASGASNFQQRIQDTGTTFLPETDGTWLMSDYDKDGIPDLVFIATGHTGSGKVEVHIASGASNYQQRILETPTTFLPETNGTWLMADYDKDGIPDLVFIKTSNASTVEVHIASGVSNYQRRIQETGTTFLPETDGAWLLTDCDRDGIPDLVFIRTSNSASDSVEVHIASGASGYQERILETTTTFLQENDGVWLMADYDKDGIPDLVFIKTGSSMVEVHMASGG